LLIVAVVLAAWGGADASADECSAGNHCVSGGDGDCRPSDANSDRRPRGDDPVAVLACPKPDTAARAELAHRPVQRLTPWHPGDSHVPGHVRPALLKGEGGHRRRHAARAAGFSGPPQTWDDFLSVCAAVSNPPNTYCYELNPDASTFSYWVFTPGGTLVSPDAKTVTFNSAAGLDSLDLIATLFQKHEAYLIAKACQDQTDFALGKIAFTFGSTAGLPYYAQAVQQGGVVTNWNISPGPHSTPNPVVELYGASITIFKTTTDKERAAFTFLKWMMDSGPNAQWCEATQYFPARQSTQAQMADFIKANPMYGEALGWVQYGQTEPALAARTAIRTYITDAMTAVADNTQTPQAAMNDLVQKSNALLAQP
jgi:ABC-type glycerol-3-phosphate transport system substrate-binding protein